MEVTVDRDKVRELTPETMRAWFKRRFADREWISVEDVRAIGPLSDHWCSEHPLAA